MRGDVVGAIALSGVLLFSSTGIALAQTVDTNLWTTDGTVNAIVTDGSTIYFGGSFTQLATTTGSSVAIDANTAVVQRPYPQVSGFVRALAPDGSGGWYLGGDFTSVGGVPRNRLAHVDGAGNLTPWNPTANNSVYAMAVSGSTVYVGGDFTIVGGASRSKIAALDGTSGAASDWNPNANNRVNSLMVSGNTVYAAGDFTSIGGQPRNRIAAFDAASSGAATAWNPNSNSTVYALAQSGDTVYVGGQFTNIGGQPRNRIAALDATSGAATAFNPNVTGTLEPGYSPLVYSLAVSGGTVYAGGNFTTVLGSPRYGTAAMDATTGVPTAFDVGTFTYGAAALAVSGNTVYAGGGFNHIGGQDRDGLAALDATTGAATAWNPSMNGYVAALAVSGGMVYVGGNSTGISMARTNLAALDAATGAATAWNPSPDANSVVNALAVSGGTVYAGGNFTSIGGQFRRCIAALDATSGSATEWNPSVHVSAPSAAEVDALVVSGGTVYAGGVFDSIGGQPRNNLAALDVNTGAATAWDPNVQGPGGYATVRTLMANGGTIYAGGDFTVVGGQPRNNIAAIDATTGAATAWNPDANSTVYALAMKGSEICGGGSFTSIGGETRNFIAAFDPVTGAATDWNPDANSGVLALTVSEGIVYAGGYFTTMAGQIRNHVAALDQGTGTDFAWDPVPNQYVRVLAAGGGKVYLGGGFTIVGGRAGSIAGVSAVDFPLSVSGRDTPSQSELALLSANPSSGSFEVRYSVTRAGRVRLQLLDVSGRVEETLVDRVHASGSYVVSWDGVGRHGRPSPGLYFVRLVTSDQVTMRKLAIIQ
jgi:hypothetical protein